MCVWTSLNSVCSWLSSTLLPDCDSRFLLSLKSFLSKQFPCYFFFFFFLLQGCYCCWSRQEHGEECGCCQHHFPPYGCLHLLPWDEHWCRYQDSAPRRKPGVVRRDQDFTLRKASARFCLQSKLSTSKYIGKENKICYFL